jgi:hypothetical protein
VTKRVDLPGRVAGADVRPDMNREGVTDVFAIRSARAWSAEDSFRRGVIAEARAG